MRLRYWLCGLGLAYGGIAAFLLTSQLENLPGDHLLDDAVIATMAVMTAILLRELGHHAEDAHLRRLALCFGATAILDVLHLVVGLEVADALAFVSGSVAVLWRVTWALSAYSLPAAIVLLLVTKDSRWRMVARIATAAAIGFAVLAMFSRFSRADVGPLGITRPELLLVPVVWVLAASSYGRQRGWDLEAGLFGAASFFAVAGHTAMLWSTDATDVASAVAHDGKLAAYAVLLLAATQRAASDTRRRVEAQRSLEQMHRALAQREERMRLALWRMNDAVWDWDVAGNQFTVSDTYRAVFGEPRDLGGPTPTAADRLHPDDRERVNASLAAAFSGGDDIWSCDYRLRRLDGSWALIQGRAYLARNTDGRVTRVVATMQDVTERAEAEEALRRSERRFRSLFHSTFSFIALLEHDGTVVAANQTALDFGGLEAGDVIGAPLWETPWMVPSADVRARLRDAIARAGKGEVVRYQLEAVGVGGARGLVDLSLKPVDDGHGVAQIVAEARDVTEQAQAVEALRESEEQFRSAMHYAAIAMALCSLEGRFLAVNAALVRLTGYGADELRHMTFQDITHPDDLEADLEYVRQMLAREIEAYQMEKRYVRKDGRIVWVLLSVSLARSASGEPRYFIGHIQDITARRAAEDEIRLLTADLERRVEERTADLARAMRELEAFSYTVSHDLRAPLRHIHEFARLLRARCDDDLGDEGRRYVKTIMAAVKHSSGLIDDLLAFSRTGNVEPRRDLVDLGGLVDESIRDVAADARDRRIEWLRGELPSVEGDAAMLALAIHNLIDNAVKYTRPRDLARIEVGAVNESADSVDFYVRDNGVGFDPRHAEKLFGAFQRLHRDDEFEGTGLGLATVRRIVERHGGSVWAESHTDEGATFFVHLPKRQGATDRRSPTERARIA